MIRDGLAIVGAGWLVVYFGGGLLGITNFLKGKIPSLAPKIDQVQERVIGGKVDLMSPVPTPTLLPNQPQPQQPARENKETDSKWGASFQLKTPWSNLETKADVK